MKLIQYLPAFGLSCPSPFCTKAEVLLKMAGLDYEDVRVNDPRKGPNNKLPAIEIDGRMIGDSELIRREIERRQGIDFDEGLSAEERAVSHAMARMIEERLYWIIVYSRWIVDETFAELKANMAATMPPIVRNIVPVVARKQVRGYLHGQGIGRHSREEIMAFAERDLAALSAHLGDKPFMMGEKATSLDATAYAHIDNILIPPFEATPLRRMALAHDNLVAYADRCRADWFPDYSRAA